MEGAKSGAFLDAQVLEEGRRKYEIFNINSFFRKAGNVLGTYYVPAVLMCCLSPHNTLPSSHHCPDVTEETEDLRC